MESRIQQFTGNSNSFSWYPPPPPPSTNSLQEQAYFNLIIISSDFDDQEGGKEKINISQDQVSSLTHFMLRQRTDFLGYIQMLKKNKLICCAL